MKEKVNSNYYQKRVTKFDKSIYDHDMRNTEFNENQNFAAMHGP